MATKASDRKETVAAHVDRQLSTTFARVARLRYPALLNFTLHSSSSVNIFNPPAFRMRARRHIVLARTSSRTTQKLRHRHPHSPRPANFRRAGGLRVARPRALDSGSSEVPERACIRLVRVHDLTQNSKSLGETLLPHKTAATVWPRKRSRFSRMLATPKAAAGSTINPEYL